MAKKSADQNVSPLRRGLPQEASYAPKMSASQIQSRVSEAKGYTDNRRPQIYKEVSEVADLPNLFEVRVGLRQPVIDLLAESGARFRFRLSKKAIKLIQAYNEKIEAGGAPLVVTKDNPCQLLWRDRKVAGLALRDGRDRTSDVAFEPEEEVELSARQSIFVWSRHGDSICNERPIARFPSLFGLVEYLGRVETRQVSSNFNRTVPE